MTESTRKRNKYRPPKKLSKPNILYDMGIGDLKERRLKVLTFPDGYDAADFLERPTKYISHFADRLNAYAKNIAPIPLSTVTNNCTNGFSKMD